MSVFIYGGGRRERLETREQRREERGQRREGEEHRKQEVGNKSVGCVDAVKSGLHVVGWLVWGHQRDD